MEAHKYGSLAEDGFEVVIRDGIMYVRYDAGAHTEQWREDEITQVECDRLMSDRQSRIDTMFAIQRRLTAAGIDPYASNWHRRDVSRNS